MSRLRERFEHHCRANISNADIVELLFIINEEIMDQLNDLRAAVQAEDTVIQGAITLINGIAQRITDAGVDQAALTALTDDINSQAAALAAAVQANTVPATGS